MAGIFQAAFIARLMEQTPQAFFQTTFEPIGRVCAARHARGGLGLQGKWRTRACVPHTPYMRATACFRILLEIKMNKIINRLWKIIGFISIVILSIYFYQFHKFPLGNQEAFGQFGDYLGGILNPILTAINTFLLIYFNKIFLNTTWKQYLDDEDKEQIFRLIENHHVILKNIRIWNKKSKHYDEGANAFWVMRGIVYKKYKTTQQINDIERLRKAYDEFYRNDGKRQYLGNYFRNLYHIFKFIENSSLENKKEYAQIVAAQMSYLEQHFLFLNCLIPEGENFKKYIVDFDLLQELPEFEFESGNPKSNIQIQEEINEWRKNLSK